MKKTLALVLALVMVIGLMAVPVKADFTDSSSIEYNEAVDVLSAVGVINGFENGSFDPAGNLTREQAAKIVAYLMLGDKNADALVATSAPFADVAADRWSAGYIAYCVNEGIINGRDANTFDPTGKVTGYEFAKLLLGCLGYSSKIEQYVGASWAINVAKTALDIDLFDGNDGANYNAPMTREEAALYAFNTLKATLVEYDSQGTSIDLGNGVIISTGASKAEEVADAGNNKNTIATDALLQFAEKYFDDLELTDAAATKDDFGRPSVIWTFDNDEVGTYADKADLTYTAEVDGDTIYTDLGKIDADVIEYYVDGFVTAVGTFDIANDDEDEIGGNGTLIEVYEIDNDADSDEDYRVVAINTYVGEVSDWTAADEDADEDEYVNVSAVSGAPTPAAALTDSGKFETTVFTEDDKDDDTVVLYTAARNGAAYEVQSVVAADSTEATPTRFTAGKTCVAGGTTYKYAANVADEVDSTMVSDKNDVSIYLDSYGYVIHVAVIEETADNYAYVIEADYDQDGIFADDVPMAKLLLESGEIVIVELDEDTVPADVNGRLAKYSVDSDDIYTLSSVTAAPAADVALSVVQGKAAVTSTSAADYVNSKTVFFVHTLDDDGDDVFDVYVGIANVPTLTGVDAASAADDTYSVAIGATAEAMYISLPDVDDETDSDDVVYVDYDADVDAAFDVDLGSYYEFNVVNGGTIETKLFAAKLVVGIGGEDGDFSDAGDVAPVLTADMLLKSVTINDDGVVTALGSAADDSYTATGTNEADDGLIAFDATVGLSGETTFAYTDDTVVYVIDDGEIEKSSIDEIADELNDSAFITLDDDGNYLTAIYISVN